MVTLVGAEMGVEPCVHWPTPAQALAESENGEPTHTCVGPAMEGVGGGVATTVMLCVEEHSPTVTVEEEVKTIG